MIPFVQKQNSCNSVKKSQSEINHFVNAIAYTKTRQSDVHEVLIFVDGPRKETEAFSFFTCLVLRRFVFGYSLAASQSDITMLLTFSCTTSL